MDKSNIRMSYEPTRQEELLVAECVKGNPTYQKKLFEKYYSKMLAVCLRYTKDRDDAKDVLQDGFVKIFQGLPKFSFNSPLDVWVRRIMVNTAIDFYRKASNLPIIKDIDLAYELADEETILSGMNHEELLTLLQKLPAGYRLVFNMYVIEGYSHKEISEMLDINEGTSKSQLSKAKMFLQKLIKSETAQRASNE